MKRKRVIVDKTRANLGLRPKLDRSLGLTLFVGAAMLLVFGLVFSVAYGSKQVTTQASALHDADESLRAATVIRAQVALAVHMSAVDRQFGTNSADARETSIDEADLAIKDFEKGMAHLEAAGVLEDTDLRRSGRELIDQTRQILSLLVTNDFVGAQDASDVELDKSFRQLSDDLVDLRGSLSEGVESSDALLGRIGNFARFLVAFLVPFAVIVIYRELMRRQQRQADLESRLKAERELNASREEFVSNASHELRTPLTSILGLSMLLAENEAIYKDPDVAELMSIIISESDDLARMVEDLLTTARLDSGALRFVFEDLRIEEAMHDIVDPLTRSGPSIDIRCEPGTVRTDRLRFRQLIRNLCSNARKYGGSNIRMEGRVEGRTYVCSVIDDGDGIPEKIEQKLFERFIHQGHQTATKDSVGLGLSIVHALAQGMGGSISYERINDETHFVLRLPLASTKQDSSRSIVVSDHLVRAREPSPDPTLERSAYKRR